MTSGAIRMNSLEGVAQFEDDKILLPVWSTSNTSSIKRKSKSLRFRLILVALTFVLTVSVLHFAGILSPVYDKAAAGWKQNNKPTSSSSHSPSQESTLQTIPQKEEIKPKYAFATLLNGNWHKEDDMMEDEYFVSTRLLCYQLLHAKETKNSINASFLVLATPEVREDKLERLRLDGATIVPVKKIETSWAFTDISTWQGVLSKLYLWELTQYDLIAFMDNDMVLTKPLDGLFEDPAVKVRQVGNIASAIKEDEGKLPSDYVFAGIPEVKQEHHYPPQDDKGDFYNINYLNAGFFVTKPSKEMFDYQMKVLSIPGKFDPFLPEQNMWNYVFRRDGNMPWTQLGQHWNIHYPTLIDIEGGVASVHDKFWNPSHKEVSDFLNNWKHKMIDYWSQKENQSP